MGTTGRLEATFRVLGNRSIVAVEVGLAMFSFVLFGSWVATMLYALAEGGVAEAGFVSFGVLAPASIAAPFVAVFFDRYRSSVALALGFLAQTLALGLVAVAIFLDAPTTLVYPAFGFFAISQMASRPTISAVLPRIVGSPTELAAANSLSGFIEISGLFIGPALAGLILVATDDLSIVFLVSAAAMLVATVLALTVSDDADRYDVNDGEVAESVWHQVAAGIGVLRREAAPRQLILLLAVSRIITGALEVAAVVIAVDRIGADDAAAGWLSSAVGVGGLVGAGVSFLLVGRRRLTMPIALGVLAASLPLVVLSQAGSLWPAAALLTLSGFGRPIIEVAGRTILQGLSPEDTLAKIFGVLEGLSLLAVGIGGITIAQLAAGFGLETALILIGFGPPAILAVLFRKLRRIDRGRPSVDPHVVALTRGVPFFAPLPAFQVEQMMHNLQPLDFAPDAPVFALGDPGDVLYLVAQGSAVVELAPAEVEIDVGGFFGEIALIRDQPRMASVRAGADGLRAYVLEGTTFLEAIAGVPRSRTRSRHVVEQRLGEA